MKMKKELVEEILTLIGLLIIWVMLLGMPLQLLWNWLMPTIFNLPYISFWQAVGLNVMAAILFKPVVKTKKD